MDHLYHGYVSHNHRVYKTLQPMTWTYLCDNHAEWWSLWSLTVPFVRPGPILIHTEECSSLWFYRMDCFTCEPLPKQAHIFSEIYTEIYVRCDRLPSSSSCWELLHILQLPGRFPQGVCLTPNLPQVSEAAWSRRNRNHPKQLKTPNKIWNMSSNKIFEKRDVTSGPSGTPRPWRFPLALEPFSTPTLPELCRDSLW